MSQKQPHPDLAGQTFGNFTLLQKIGEGSMGVVYRGYQNNLSRPVALKVVFRDRLNPLLTAERFRQEAELAANLMHPNIVTIYEFGERPDLLYFVMQLVDGINLSQWLKQKKKHPSPLKRLPSLEELARIAEQGLDVLGFAHDEGVVHRDIKPENIMWLEKTQRILITDFGLAAVFHTVYTEEKAFVLGSPLYVSPEQARGETVDGRADLFSFGCVLLELTLGFLPVKVERPEKVFMTRAKESPDMFTGSAIDHMPTVAVEWNDFLLKAVAPKKENRFANAHEMLKHLKNILPQIFARGY